MRKQLFLVLLVSTTCFALPALERKPQISDTNKTSYYLDGIMSDIHANNAQMHSISLKKTEHLLLKQRPALGEKVTQYVLQALKCAKRFDVTHNNILTIIDYSLPSSKKRLWVFDLKKQKLLFHTYVTHGINSGHLDSHYFSNINNSKTSSIGIFSTESAYYGRHGLAVRLKGLDHGFNHNASRRYLVMHGGWYVNKDFIAQYGRPGRSWGCPAIPKHLVKPLINTIKDKSFVVAYYPNDAWLARSRFLNCDKAQPAAFSSTATTKSVSPTPERTPENAILFADLNKNDSREKSEPIVVMSASGYQKTFHTGAPLTRMLRRQIDKKEYVALSNQEFTTLLEKNPDVFKTENKNAGNAAYFVIPEVKMRGRYYIGTIMKIIRLGNVQEIISEPSDSTTRYHVQFEKKNRVHLNTSNRFIRWLGL